MAVAKVEDMNQQGVYAKELRMSQVSMLYDLWPEQSEWFILGGTAQELEAQTLATQYPNVKYIGFEPNPESAKAQNEYLGFPGKVHQCALWRNETDKLELTLPLGHNPARGSVCRPDNSPDLQMVTEWQTYSVKPRTLDSLSDEFGPFNNAVLWLDIEYAELPALEGATRLLDRVLMVNLETHCHIGLAPISTLLAKRGLYMERVWNIGEITHKDAQDYIFIRK